MKPKVPPKLGRLLGEYERLTTDEAAAVRARDFPALAEIHAFKPQLLAEIVAEAGREHIDRKVAWFNERLDRLAELERENVNFAARVLAQLRVQRENLDQARKRLRGLGNAYRRSGSSSSRLFAMS